MMLVTSERIRRWLLTRQVSGRLRNTLSSLDSQVGAHLVWYGGGCGCPPIVQPGDGLPCETAPSCPGWCHTRPPDQTRRTITATAPAVANVPDVRPEALAVDVYRWLSEGRKRASWRAQEGVFNRGATVRLRRCLPGDTRPRRARPSPVTTLAEPYIRARNPRGRLPCAPQNP
jgi:hypothetical protein